jgi:hypothetical protein
MTNDNFGEHHMEEHLEEIPVVWLGGSNDGHTPEEAEKLLAEDGMDLRYGDWLFRVERSRVEGMIQHVSRYDSGEYGPWRESALKEMKRFDNRMREGTATQEDMEEAAFTVITLHAIKMNEN